MMLMSWGGSVGRTALHVAAQYGSRDAADTLLGAKVTLGLHPSVLVNDSLIVDSRQR